MGGVEAYSRCALRMATRIGIAPQATCMSGLRGSHIGDSIERGMTYPGSRKG